MCDKVTTVLLRGSVRMDVSRGIGRGILHSAIYCGSLPPSTPPLLPLFNHHLHLLTPLIEILPGTQTLSILGTKLRERNTQEPVPIVCARCVCAKRSVSRTKGPGEPIGVFLPLLPAVICSNFEDFCWQLGMLRAF